MTTVPRAKKSLGQHFLKDAKTASRIVDLLRIDAKDRVLEIGPGPGAITGIIQERRPSQFRVVEKDSYWASFHAEPERFQNDKALTAIRAGAPAVAVQHGDALEFPWESLEGPWKIISNLPYNVGSPLMWDIVSRVPELTRAVFMVQKEVAQRLYAQPGTHDYGALSVWIQSYVRVEWGFVVGPGAFSPPPKVDSAVVTFVPLPRESFPADPVALSSMLKLCFQMRRKQLQSILRRAGKADAATLLQQLGIVPEARPETLSPHDFQRLAEAWGQLRVDI
ncbi:MAG: 16S rRNA (adenine(1518)-N(6)/adenine(1519)-N(6))-dimethyltransferase RsmA [Bilophila sp.]